MWPDRRILDLFRIEHPILLGPMASAVDDKLAIAVAQGGGLGAIPCAMITAEHLREQLAKYRAAVKAPVNVNFFCHTPPQLNNAREVRWRERLKPYYEELAIDPAAPVPTSNRAPFDDAFCAVIEDLKPWRLSPWVLRAYSVLELAGGALKGSVKPGHVLEIA